MREEKKYSFITVNDDIQGFPKKLEGPGSTKTQIYASIDSNILLLYFAYIVL